MKYCFKAKLMRLSVQLLHHGLGEKKQTSRQNPHSIKDAFLSLNPPVRVTDLCSDA